MADLQISHTKIANGEKLHVHSRSGKGIPLVFIHGNMSSSAIFIDLIRNMNIDNPVIAPDLRGFGQSSYETVATDIKTYASDVKQLLESQGHKQAILIGHGAGNAVVMRLALDEPGLVERFVMLASCSVAGHPIRKRIFFNLIKSKTPIRSLEGMKVHVAPMESYKENNQRWIIRQMLNKLFFNIDKPLDNEIERNIEAVLNQRNLPDFNLAISRFNIYSDDNGLVDGSNETRKFKQESIIIHGDKDAVMPVGIAKFNERVMAKKPTTHIINGAGYVPFVGYIRKVTNLIETFIENAKS